MATFSEYEIINNDKEYKKKLLFCQDISHTHYDCIIKEMEKAKPNVEYSVFTKGREIVYDNKTKGGRITFKIGNAYNNLQNKIFLDLIKINYKNTDYVFKPLQKLFIKMSYYLLVKNAYIEDNLYRSILDNQNEIKSYSKLFEQVTYCIEGILLQESQKDIKLVIYIDENLSENNLILIGSVLKKLLLIPDNISLAYTPYKSRTMVNI